jgi:hypothetical protein
MRVLAVLLAVAFVCGCAGLGKGPSDLELVQAQVKSFSDALVAKNLDKVMACVSENFYHPEAGDKAAARAFLQQGIDSGYTQDGKVDLAKMEVKIEKDKATAYPIVASAAPGSVTVGLTLKKEKAGWLITEINVEGI